MPATRVQIFGVEHFDDATATAEAGADQLGFRPLEDPAFEGEQALSSAELRRLFAQLPRQVAKVLLFATPDESLVLRLTEATDPDMIQLCWQDDALGPEREASLREKLSGVTWIKEIAVGDHTSRERAVAAALRYEGCADLLILDTNLDPRWIGATGRVHDWSISRDIVRRVGLPCILAGGLGADNVRDAMEAVQPWGVDSYSRTNLPNGRKDIVAVRGFIEAVREFDEGLGSASTQST